MRPRDSARKIAPESGARSRRKWEQRPTYVNTASVPFTASMVAIDLEHVSTDVGLVVGKVSSTDTSTTCEPHTSSPLDDTSTLVEDTTATTKKKKKKKPKKSTKSKGEPSVKPLTEDDDEPGPLVLRISRNKHWRYISSYHVRPSPLVLTTLLHHEKIGSMASAPD
jgi:hypothetical protein